MKYLQKPLRDKIKIVLLALLLVLTSNFSSNAQFGNPYHEIDSQLRSMYSGMCRDTLGPKFLFEQAVHTLDSIYFTDNNPDTLVRDYWFTIYEELKRCAYDTSILEHRDTVLVRSLQWQNDTVNMNFLAYNMNWINDTMLDVDWFDIDTINMTITDKNPCEVDAYIVQRVYAASPVELVLPSLQPTYRIDTAFFFHDEWNDLIDSNWTLEIDFGDGAGWQSYSPGTLATTQYYNATYSSGGNKYIKTRVIDASLNVKMSSIATAYVSGAQYKLPKADEEIPFPGIAAGVYNPCDESGEPLKKIVFYLEGIDLGDFLPGLNRTHREIYDEMVKKSQLDKLRNYGYTIIVIDWMNSRLDIKTNAAFLEDVLDYYKCQQRVTGTDTGTHEQFVIIGESMGGLVARYALCEMEDLASNNTLGGCLPEKIHNTRLLITFDTPHEGANVPLAYQHVFRDAGRFLLGANTVTQSLTGGMLNMFLDAKAAQQMMLYHVDTKSGTSYSEHSDRTAFKSDLNAIGNYPAYTKLMAMSNGSMNGMGQTHIYDTVQRTANDYLLQYNSDLYARMFANDFKVLGTNVTLRTSPNSTTGNIVTITRDTYHPKIEPGYKIKFRWPWPPKITLKPKITSSLSSSVGVTHNANVEPYDVIPGGVQDYNGQIVKGNTTDLSFLSSSMFFGFKTPNYNSTTHTWSLENSAYIGNFGSQVTASMYSDGMHFCFIPNFSGLDYDLPNNNYYFDIASDNATNNMSRTPFDVISGQVHTYNSFSLYRNQQHLAVRNEGLGTWRTGAYSVDSIFRHGSCSEDGNRLPMYILNREIGEDTLIVENRTTDWTCIYDAELHVGVNVRDRYYRYPTATGSTLIMGGFFSKEDPYVIAGGTSHFAATSSSVTYGTPSLTPGTFLTENIDWVKCCNENTGQKSTLSTFTERTVSNIFKIIPNPVVSSDVIFEFSAVKDANTIIQIYDAMGRKITENKLVIKENTQLFRYHHSMTGDFQHGTYFVLIRNGERQYKGKMVIN